MRASEEAKTVVYNLYNLVVGQRDKQRHHRGSEISLQARLVQHKGPTELH